MFSDNTRPRRKHTTTEVFWTFVAVCRDALDQFEAEQVGPLARPQPGRAGLRPQLRNLAV